MSSEPASSEFISLLQRATAGDADARKQLGEHLHNRLSRLCRLKLAHGFPIVADHHDLDSVVHDAWIEIMRAIDGAQIRKPEHLLPWLGTKVRYVLIDMANALRRRLSKTIQAAAGDTSSVAGFDPGQSTVDPAKLAAWGEFHEAVAALPPNERQIVELHYYCDISQADIAQQLGLPPKQVSRTWLNAREKLVKYL